MANKFGAGDRLKSLLLKHSVTKPTVEGLFICQLIDALFTHFDMYYIDLKRIEGSNKQRIYELESANIALNNRITVLEGKLHRSITGGDAE
jgi:hypothetical protein